MTTPTPDPTPADILAAIYALRAEQRAGLADVRRAIARASVELHAEVVRVGADLAALAVTVNQVADALADHVREQHS